MYNLFIFLLIIILFYLLGRTADLVIFNVKQIGEKLGIKIFFLGLMLGIFTSLPELGLGVNALIDNIPAISLGNLLGGIIVLFSLILGLSLILNRQIYADGSIKSLHPPLIFLFLPLLLGLDKKIDIIDGLILVGLYLLILIYLYRHNRNSVPITTKLIYKSKVLKSMFLILLGLILVVLFSNLIIRLTLILLSNYKISVFSVGLLFFSLGTNLPEIIVTIRSWRRQVKELSFSNLLGSAMTNILLIGIFSIIETIQLEINFSYWILFIFMLVLFLCLLIFYKTEKRLTRKEGLVLVFIYILFLLCEIFF